MKLTIPALSAVLLCLLPSCASEAQNYARAHPELTPVQRRMMNAGKIPDGTAVAGLTKAQVHLIMGGDPTTFDKADDMDMWVYSHKKAVAMNPRLATGPSDSTLDTHGMSSNTEANAPRVDVDVKTTIYFQGDVAVRAQTVEEKP